MSAPVLDLFRLDGKVAVVTGCKRGIGRAFARALAEAGANIIGVSRTLQPGSEVEGEVIASDGRFNASPRRTIRTNIGTRRSEPISTRSFCLAARWGAA